MRIRAGGKNYFANPPTSDPNPGNVSNNYGTAVAGVAAAIGDNGIGVSGIAPKVHILPIKVFQGASFTTNVAAGDAIRYAADAGAHVISNSWGGGSPSSFITDAIVYASTMGRGGKGCPVLFASGNAGDLFGKIAPFRLMDLQSRNLCYRLKNQWLAFTRLQELRARINDLDHGTIFEMASTDSRNRAPIF